MTKSRGIGRGGKRAGAKGKRIDTPKLARGVASVLGGATMDEALAAEAGVSLDTLDRRVKEARAAQERRPGLARAPASPSPTPPPVVAPAPASVAGPGIPAGDFRQLLATVPRVATAEQQLELAAALPALRGLLAGEGLEIRIA